ncbi:MAG TPA: hypothetical protein VGM18_12100 [Candidatus Sulfotelmatobacter sp.]|jgi:hypothetical protein
MPTTVLNITDLDNLIRGLEDQYGISSLEMLKDTAARKKLSEDVLLRWETYVRQRLLLREVDAEVRSGYLAKVKAKSKKSPTPGDQAALAA